MQQSTELKEFLKQFRNTSNTKGIYCILGNWILIITLSFLSQLCFYYTQIGLLSLSVYFISSIIIASRLRGFENLVHEASHGNLFKSKRIERYFRFLFAGIVFKNLSEWSREHRLHHKYLGNTELDPDFQRYKTLGMLNLKKNFYWKVFGRPLLGFEHIYFIENTFIPYWTSKKHVFSKCIWLFIITICINNHILFALFLKYYIIPFFVILPLPRFWCEMSEHTGISFSDSLWIGKSRSNLGVIHQYLMHPFSDGYHEVHHLDEQIPWYNLKKAHKALIKKYPSNLYCTSNSFVETIQQMKT